MTRTICKCLALLCATSTALIIAAGAQDMPRTKTEKIRGETQVVSTEKIHGTVMYAEGNDLVVRLSNGQVDNFVVPDSRKFMIDGKEVPVSELKPGTKLTATITQSHTPVTHRTTTVGTGKVWFVSGNNVIITLPNNENRMFKVNENYRFIVNGNKASVHDLRKGMIVSAEKIVEAPTTEMAQNVEVVGHAPAPPVPVRSEIARAPAPVRQQTPAPAPVAAPAPAPSEPAPAEPAPAAPAELPKTASPLPFLGLLGSLFTAAALLLRARRTTL